MRSENPFPLQDEQLQAICMFLVKAWESGWLDEYADEHFLIQAIECRLSTFVGKDQLIENNIDYQGMFDKNGNLDTNGFCTNFCINLSCRLQRLSGIFGEGHIKSFVTDQLSAGKKHYNEDAFFEALSEVSILSFFTKYGGWKQAYYEPPVKLGENSKNPEASFSGEVRCKTIDSAGMEELHQTTISVEVKSPAFPHDSHCDEKIMIPTILLTEEGRKTVSEYCKHCHVRYLAPRVLKLRDFLNSACEKFSFPKNNGLNLLYINWSYRDFPSNAFLEAWSLLTNQINGVLTHPEIGKSLGIREDVYQKITAVIVYTESLEGLMFSDFRYVWQQKGAGPRFRMWVIDEKLRNAELSDASNLLFRITGMIPDNPGNHHLLLDYKAITNEQKLEALKFATDLNQLLAQNALEP